MLHDTLAQLDSLVFDTVVPVLLRLPKAIVGIPAVLQTTPSQYLFAMGGLVLLVVGGNMSTMPVVLHPVDGSDGLLGRAKRFVTLYLTEALHVVVLVHVLFGSLLLSASWADPAAFFGESKAIWFALILWSISLFTLTKLVATLATSPTSIHNRLKNAGVPNTIALSVRSVLFALVPMPWLFFADIDVVRDVPYNPKDAPTDWRQMLDVYRPKKAKPPTSKPIFVFIHGGSLMSFDKGYLQAGPVCSHLVTQGFVCFSVNYRLAPGFALPQQVIDVKRAIAWIKSEGARKYGGDASRVAVGGISAGAYLAVMMATTANDAAFQPGFEQADTSVIACVDMAGIHDLPDSQRMFKVLDGGAFRHFAEKILYQTSDPAYDYNKFSPYHRVASASSIPPILGIHGSLDSLIPIDDAVSFFTALKAHRSRKPSTGAAAAVPDVLIELKYAHHAHVVIPSVRTVAVHEAIATYLTFVLSKL